MLWLRGRRALWASIGLGVIAAAAVLLHDNLLPLYDNGLYHIQTILWNTEMPLTPGLANLHGRLGFNSLLFLIASVTDDVAFGWIANAIAATFVLCALAERLFVLAKDSAPSTRFWYLAVTAVVFAVSPAWLAWLGILNADSFAAVVTAYAVYLWFEYLEGVRDDTTPSVLVLVSLLTVLVKMSALPLLGAPLILYAVRRGPRPALRVLGVAAVAIVMWSARGVVMSGCAAYPIPQTCIAGVPWTVSPERVDGESSGIRSWARTPGRIDYHAVLSNWDWLGPWAERVKTQEPIPRLRWAVPLGIVVLLLRWLTRRPAEGAALVVAGLLTLCVGWWFWSAPDPRFGSGFLASLSILPLAIALSWLPLSSQLRMFGTAGVLLLTVGMALVSLRVHSWHESMAIPSVDVRTITARSGIAVRVPDHGDQCWDRPVPCVPPYYVDQDAFAKVWWRRAPPVKR
jgi:hypothetical protein